MVKGIKVAGTWLSLEEIRQHQDNIKRLSEIYVKLGVMDWYMVLNADLHLLDALIAFVEAAPDET